MIQFHSEIEDYEIDFNSGISNWITKSIEIHDRGVAEINFIFLGDDGLLEINRKHLNHDYYTDVITFDYCEGNFISGDIYISIDRVRENAKSYSESFDRELARVMIHGVLHLLGFEDKSEDKKKEMRKEEEKLLNLHPEL